jgi:hypothetical protein
VDVSTIWTCSVTSIACCSSCARLSISPSLVWWGFNDTRTYRNPPVELIHLRHPLRPPPPKGCISIYTITSRCSILFMSDRNVWDRWHPCRRRTATCVLVGRMRTTFDVAPSVESVATATRANHAIMSNVAMAFGIMRLTQHCIAIGLVVCGPSRFSARACGLAHTCSSVLQRAIRHCRQRWSVRGMTTGR